MHKRVLKHKSIDEQDLNKQKKQKDETRSNEKEIKQSSETSSSGKQSKTTWTSRWNFPEISTSALEQSAEVLSESDNSEETEELLDLTQTYFENNQDKEEIWKNAKLTIYDSEGNELIIIGGEGEYKLFVHKVKGKPNIICLKDHKIIFGPGEF